MEKFEVSVNADGERTETLKIFARTYEDAEKEALEIVREEAARRAKRIAAKTLGEDDAIPRKLQGHEQHDAA